MPPRLVHFADPLPPPATDRPAPERALGPSPLRTTWEAYAAADGLSIGEWACEPGAWRIAFHDRRHEFFHVLEGRLRIVDEDGRAREFGAGDAGVIPAGFRGTFEVLAAVRKRYVMIDPPA
ncbi:cupin domain-containing protein [Azospira restricta]|uniref:DUF861 domain-containing protein n=1 Tax=Azospira restricta TaxID=404405 RepID=A0A974SQA2_9RHOO|nr:cupin domain-containing protein [Azospira restricta]QRJ64409.1 DUF861 domain-containing protein [Azospira restricta]